MKSKKGAEHSATASVAALILLIALFFVVYLVLLPEDARKDVLKGEDIDYEKYNDDNDENGNGVDEEVLLLREPGVVLPPGKDEIEKDFASANLLDTTKRSTKKLADRITVSRTLFNNNYKTLDFEIDDSKDLEDLGLFFNVIEDVGDLIIELNDNVIFEGGVDVGDMPIKLPVVNLRGVNRLKFMASSPGYAFLSTNRYVIRDIELVKEASLVNKEELRRFEVSRAEAIGDATLEFFVNCVEILPDQGVLKVSLNRRNVFFSKVVCDASQSEIDLPDDYFEDGTNYLTFEVDKGNYIIEQIKLKYKFDEAFNPKYYFTVDDEQFEEIKDGDAKVKLKMRFSNDKDRKRADIRINSKTIYLDQQASKFDKDITDFVEEGENFIKIFAREEFEIVLLEIDFEK